MTSVQNNVPVAGSEQGPDLSKSEFNDDHNFSWRCSLILYPEATGIAFGKMYIFNRNKSSTE